jgi:ABC-2 type transport system permease protein
VREERASVIGALLRVALMTAMQYRTSFLVESAAGLGASVGVVVPLVFVYDHTAQVAGWSFHAALLVTGFFLVLQGLVGAFVEPNLGAIVEAVRTGTLDFLLLKPPDAQLVMSVNRLAPVRLWDVLAGLAVAGWGLVSLPTPSALQAVAAAGLLLAGLTAMYGLWLLVVCTSFWFVRVDNLRYLLGSVVDAGRWPVSVYRGWIRTFVTVVVPVAIVTSYPALALLGQLDVGLVAHAVAVALGMLVLSRLAWRHALRHYTSASS